MEPSEFPTFTDTQMGADSGVNIQPTIMWVASTATNTATGEMRNIICYRRGHCSMTVEKPELLKRKLSRVYRMLEACLQG